MLKKLDQTGERMQQEWKDKWFVRLYLKCGIIQRQSTNSSSGKQGHSMQTFTPAPTFEKKLLFEMLANQSTNKIGRTKHFDVISRNQVDCSESKK